MLEPQTLTFKYRKLGLVNRTINNADSEKSSNLMVAY